MVQALLAIVVASAAPAQPADLFGSGAGTAEEKAARAKDVVAAVARHYRSDRSEERLAVRAADADRRETQTEVLWRFDPGKPTTRTLRVELGTLHVYAHGERLIAVHALNTGTYFEAALPGGVTAESLRHVIPSLPFPQAAWALEDASAGTVGEVLAQTSWESTRSMPMPAGAGTVRGVHASGAVFGTCIVNELGVARLSAWAMPARAGTALRLMLDCEPLAASDPSSWVIPTQGRRRVESLGELRPAEPALGPGRRLPAMGLMTATLSSWPLADALRTAADGPLNAPDEARPTDTFAVLVLHRPGAAGAAEQTRAAAVELRKDLDRQRAGGRTTLPRFFVRVVCVLELAEVNDPNGVRVQAAKQPLPTTEPSTEPLFCAGGKALMDSFTPGAEVLAVVVDADEKIRAIVPVPGDGEIGELLREGILGPGK